MKNKKRKVILAVLVTLLVAAAPVVAELGTVASHDDETDFENATTLDNMTVEGTGEDAYVTAVSSVGGYEAEYAFTGDYENDTGNYTDFADNADAWGVDSGVQWTQSFLDGGDYMVTFDTGEKINMDNQVDLDEGPEKTVSVWLQFPDWSTYSGTDYHGVVGDLNWGSGRDWQIIQRTDNNDLEWYVNLGGTEHILKYSTTSNAPMHVVMRYNGTHAAMIVNDTQVDVWDAPDGASWDDSKDAVYMGQFTDSSHGMKGDVEELRFYNKSLTDSEISELYNNPVDGLVPAADQGTYTSANFTNVDADQAYTELVLDNVTADVAVEGYDGSSWATVDSGQFTSNGTYTFDLNSSSLTKWRFNYTWTQSSTERTIEIHEEGLNYDATPPDVNNTSATPTGTLESSTADFSIDVSDKDFPTSNSDELNASLYVDGVFKGNTTLTSNGTATIQGVSISGETTYHWNVTDQYGLSTESDTFSVSTPATLHVYNETGDHGKITNIQVNATATGESETVDLRVTDTGEIKLGGLDTSQSYVFTLNAEGYHPREIYIEDLYQEQAVYLLSKDVASVENTLSITDRTGRYSENTIIEVQRVINTSKVGATADEGPQWVVVGGDRLGTSGFYVINFETYGRYQFVVKNAQGDSRILGEYTAKQDGPVDLQIGSVKYTLGGETWGWDADLNNVTDGNYSATFAYNDPENRTWELNATVRTRDNGTVIGYHEWSNSSDDAPYGEVAFSVPINQSQYENNSFIVEFNATQNGTVVTGSRLLGGKDIINLPIDGMWQNMAFAGLVLVLAFLVGAAAGAAPALVTIGVFSMFGVYIGLAPPELGFGSTILVLLMAALYTVAEVNRI